ncbi:hypothetical protein RQP50_00005, partial [Paenibacillus sp. chi10]
EVGNNEAKRSSMGTNVTHSSTFFKSRVVSQVVKTYLWDSPIYCLIISSVELNVKKKVEIWNGL